MTNNYTDTQLKQALAKMLPDDVKFIHGAEIYEFDLMWRKLDRGVLDTELLHLCWLVEQSLLRIEFAAYQEELNRLLSFNQRIASAAWQQRVIALAKVKGVEI